MTFRISLPALVAAWLLAVPVSPGPLDAAEFYTLKGHGGPVMDIAISPNGAEIATASFDNSVGIWHGRTPHWLEKHAAAVNEVMFIDNNRVVSAGDDFSIVLWDLSAGTSTVLGRHKGKVTGLAVSPDLKTVASASWDGSIGLWPLSGGEPAFLKGHTAGVNDAVFSADGKLLYSASTDGTIRTWDMEARQEERLLLRHGFGVNVMTLNAERDFLAYGAVDGVTRVIDLAADEMIADFSLDRRPILAMAQDPAGSMLAVGDGHGFIMIVDTTTWKIKHDFRAALRGPIWALVFSADGQSILAGGIENIVYSWPIGQIDDLGPMSDSKPKFLKDPAKMENGERQFARKCSICHALTPDGGRKAGPTLHALFGRQAGTVDGYNYSPILAGSDLVWSEATVDQLFDLGPDHYIPGSKMPMQRITARKDRDDLIDYLRKATTVGEEVK